MCHEKPGAGEGKGYFRADVPWQGEIEAEVPGTAQTALLTAGAIQDPYYARNNLMHLWMEDKEWWWRKDFVLPMDWEGRTIRVVFEGVDYRGAFWVNDEYLGEHEGMFGGPAYDITGLLRWRETNSLVVKVAPPPKNWRSALKYLEAGKARCFGPSVYRFGPCPVSRLGPAPGSPEPRGGN
jgi:beta-mannosidase